MHSPVDGASVDGDPDGIMGPEPVGNDIHGDGYVLASLSILVLIGLQVLVDDPSDVPLWLPIFLFGLGVMGILRANWIAFAFLAFPIWSLLGALLSNRLIEEGSYITEQFRSGFSNGATNLIALYSLAMLIAAHALIARGMRSWVPLDRERSAYRIDKVATLLCFVLLGILVFYVAILMMYGVASGSDRFSYWNSMQPQVRAAVQGVRSLGTPITAFTVLFAVITTSRSLRRYLLVLLVMLQIPLWLMGDKFSPFIGSLMAALSGLGLAYLFLGKSFRVRASYALWASLAVAATLTALVQGFTQMAGSRGESDGAADAILGRTVLQGHVWFGIFDRSQSMSGALASMSDLLAQNSLENPTGLNYLSYLVSRPEYVNARLERGVTFTMGGPASPLAFAGPMLGLLLYVAIGCLYALQFTMIVAALKQGRYVFCGLGLLASVPLHSVVLMGNWYSIYNEVGIVVIAAAVILMISRRRDAYSGAFVTNPRGLKRAK